MDRKAMGENLGAPMMAISPRLQNAPSLSRALWVFLPKTHGYSTLDSQTSGTGSNRGVAAQNRRGYASPRSYNHGRAEFFALPTVAVT
jgi:hypothetical protein